MNPADLVERLREDANGLRQAVSQASFASDTYVRVKQPDLLIAVLNEAADEIERLRAALADLMSWFPDEPSLPQWYLPSGEYGADDAIKAARATLKEIGGDNE